MGYLFEPHLFRDVVEVSSMDLCGQATLQSATLPSLWLMSAANIIVGSNSAQVGISH